MLLFSVLNNFHQILLVCYNYQNNLFLDVDGSLILLSDHHFDFLSATLLVLATASKYLETD